MFNHSATQPQAVCFTLWFSTHNNPRYAELFPRLDPIVRFHKVTLSHHRLVRGIQYRLWSAFSGGLIYPGVLGYFARRYETLFTVDYHQIPAWPRHGRVVVDIDDPVFDQSEARLLNLPQVKSIIVTTHKAKQMFEQLGVTRPIWIIPQGVSMEQIDPCKVQAIRSRYKDESDWVVGYHAPTLTLCADGPKRAREGQDDLDFLFAALEKAREVEPRLKLWLFGVASDAVKKYVAAGRTAWIKLFGYQALSDLLNYISNFDLGVYPRTWSPPAGRFSVKIAQFMACGVPIVSTAADESFIVREAQCGSVCSSQEEFGRVVVELASAPGRSAEMGERGRKYAAANLSWSVLMQRYEKTLS